MATNSPERVSDQWNSQQLRESACDAERLRNAAYAQRHLRQWVEDRPESYFLVYDGGVVEPFDEFSDLLERSAALGSHRSDAALIYHGVQPLRMILIGHEPQWVVAAQ